MTASGCDAPVRVGGIAVGSVGAGWRERALAPPTPFALRDGALTLIAAGDDFAGRSAALADWAQRVRERWDPPGWRDEPIVVRATPHWPTTPARHSTKHSMNSVRRRVPSKPSRYAGCHAIASRQGPLNDEDSDL